MILTGFIPFLLGYFPRPFKFLRCGLAGTAVGRDQQLLIGLFGIQNVRDCLAQKVPRIAFDFSNCHTASIFFFQLVNIVLIESSRRVDPAADGIDVHADLVDFGGELFLLRVVTRR